MTPPDLRVHVHGPAECLLALLAEYDLDEASTDVVLLHVHLSPVVLRAFRDRARQLGVDVEFWPQPRLGIARRG